MTILLALSLTFALALQGGSCREIKNVAGENRQSAQAETWGGRHARADVDERGRVSFEFDCAHGAADGPLVSGGDSSFDLRGFFVVERGGPVRAGQEERRLPARYSGHIKGETMTLTVTLTETGEEIGSFTLTRGAPAHLTKCL